ncbi:MAG: fatty acid desaturase [Deltaproteobacteria bacterium]|nr:fatty acid desaturase [Deltaproteobacteria bacterium]
MVLRSEVVPRAAAWPGQPVAAGLGLSHPANVWVLVATAIHALVVVGALAAGWVGVPLLALAVVWGSNTISHIHLHTPIFAANIANRIFSVGLTLALGVPQSIWKARHLRHHARHPERVPRVVRGAAIIEIAMIVGMLSALVAVSPAVAAIWSAGVALGYLLSGLQGKMEHDGEVAEGWSTYGKWHNRIWLNDGHHAEHHRHPGVHWSELPRRRLPDAPRAAHGPLWRGLGWFVPAALGALERGVMRSRWLREAVVAVHARAIAKVWRQTSEPAPSSVLIVGGGLFPRTALVVDRLWPESAIVIVDCDPKSIALGQAYLARHAPGLAARVRWEARRFDGDARGCALVSLPLALRALGATAGDGTRRLVHTWVWRRPRGPRPATAVVAWWLMKRVTRV